MQSENKAPWKRKNIDPNHQFWGSMFCFRGCTQQKNIQNPSTSWNMQNYCPVLKKLNLTVTKKHPPKVGCKMRHAILKMDENGTVFQYKRHLSLPMIQISRSEPNHCIKQTWNSWSSSSLPFSSMELWMLATPVSQEGAFIMLNILPIIMPISTILRKNHVCNVYIYIHSYIILQGVLTLLFDTVLVFVISWHTTPTKCNDNEYML